MHEVLVNRLGGLSLPRKSVVRLTDRPNMTLDVNRGRKTTMQQQHYYFTLQRYINFCDFFLFHVEIEGKCGWIIGGAKGYVAPLLNYWGEGAWPPTAPPPPLVPMS